MPSIAFTINGIRREVQAPGDTPLLYVLRNDLELSGPQFGCGLSQCGACSVLVDGKEARSCVLPVSRVADKEVTTLEGLPGALGGPARAGRGRGERTLHPVQQAWIDEQVPQCGFCQNGMMIKAAELLEADARADGGANQERVHDRRRRRTSAAAAATRRSSTPCSTPRRSSRRQK